MTQSRDDAIERASRHLQSALNELKRAAEDGATIHDELRSNRAAIESLTQRIDAGLQEDREQRVAVVEHLAGLAHSLDRLVAHMESLTNLMADVSDRLGSAPAASSKRSRNTKSREPSFMPGGDGISLALADVSGFQALMEIQKALAAMEEVEGASVERFQDGDARIQLRLNASLTASQVTDAIHSGAGLACSVEEALPELMSLRLRILGNTG